MFSALVLLVLQGAPLAPRQVTFESQGVALAGEISYPPGSGPFPAVALVHGSGPVTRAGNAPLVALFNDLGIAALSYDKRGTGASGGAYRGVGVRNSDSMIALLGADAASAVRLLATDPRVDGTRVGLAGGSQAGWVIAAALGTAPVRFFVALSGPAVSVGEEIYYSDLFEDTQLPLAQADSLMSLFHGASGYDPRADLQKGNAVGLYILGGLDRSVPTSRSVARLHAIDPAGARYTILVLPTGNHSLFDPRSGVAVPFDAELVAWLHRVGVR